LTAHNNGQWCKKIRGKIYFFGTWDDPQAAHEQYLKQAAELHVGRTPSLPVKGVSVNRLVKQYLEFQAGRVQGGEIGGRWYEDCRRDLTAFTRFVGPARLVDDLGAEVWIAYRAKLSRKLGVHALARAITIIKGVFRFGEDVGLIDASPKFRRVFEKPSTQQKRRSRQKAEQANGKKLFSPDEVRRILDAASPWLRAAAMLGINGGMGNTDLATLPLSALDLDKPVIDYRRPKTGIERVVPLWTKTVEAIKLALEARPTPHTPDAEKLVFLTKRGQPLVRQRIHAAKDDGIGKVTNIDRLSGEFDALLTGMGLKRRGVGFYTLRHTFRTLADETLDTNSIHRIMGHSLPGMSEVYVEGIELPRMRLVVDHVHDKLFS